MTNTPSRERATVVDRIALLVALLALILSLLQLAFPNLIRDIAEAGVPPEECGNHPGLERLIPKPEDFEATASSTLADSPPYSYHPGKVLDAFPETAWTPAGHDGGRGEWLTITFKDKPIDLQLVCVINGYASDNHTYEINGRLQDVVTKSDAGGSETTTLRNLSVEHMRDLQELNIADGETQMLRLTIQDSIAGEFSEEGGSQDVCLSEIELFVKPPADR